ncbi:uncharacterized protein L3040_001716 [Drepanopeziza brunnea f. sp. 'multigermtubi']|uniref:Uncharacterized protein n=1 Tax=Marssonina brunnea f. sp. multigermtubi (strain MB_m1) TaxID=1072389 RepID=K1WSH0_MARBU|nr:uncharacterized protein MBM_06563 [Drepanopeziza brunnea f. sp. 'multigermtubi' MB_m1]EKD15347.1 hypothetical protein MBM_06563 [Drepanopeziza brunnea f. sp. 'multigermtubi' MB_m1]KAJ5051955.1 hypothetical protein L3040_001716 [Drepanopeziza brunnea f. sp. 'multigermtubi']
MPTQLPFFSNFLAAFRAHSAIQTSKAASSSSSASPSSSQATSSYTTASSPSQPRQISSSTSTSTSKPGATTALTSLHSPRTHSTSPLSHSPGSPAAEKEAVQQGRYMASRNRRGSDSSSEGFRDVLGAEKWYIGGRTAGGEERYFKLGVVRRKGSRDRLSLDRLSL